METCLNTSEDLCNSERLRQESLKLSGTLNGQLISFRQFVHTQNGNDILQRLVFLEHLLDLGSGIVVVLSDNTGIQHTRFGVKRVDSRVDTQLRDTTGQDSGGVQMGESGGGSRISQIVSRHVDGLHGSNGSFGGSCDTLLHETHIDGESGLVTDGRWDTTKKGRHFGTGLSESENVVNEEQHVLTFLVAEVLGNRQL